MTQIRMSHVTHMNESCPHTNESCCTHEWVTSHIWISHITHMNESYHTYEQGLPHIWMNKCHTYEWVRPHIRMNHITHMNTPWHTCKWVTSHTWMSHMTQLDESCQILWQIWLDECYQVFWFIWLRPVTTRNARACRITHSSLIHHSSLTHHSLLTHSTITPHSLIRHVMTFHRYDARKGDLKTDSTLQRIATHHNKLAATHCNTLQHTATHCNTLQHRGNTLQHTATHCNTLQHTVTCCITLHHTATHCNTLQRRGVFSKAKRCWTCCGKMGSVPLMCVPHVLICVPWLISAWHD